MKKVIVETVREAVEMLEAGVDIQEAVMSGANVLRFWYYRLQHEEVNCQGYDIAL
jgi:hypothetical protein